MLSRIDVSDSAGNLLNLPLEEATQGFIVEDIQGLEPVKATLFSSGFATMDGAQYQTSRREPRNIVIKLAMEPDHEIGSIRDIRAALYKFFMPKTAVTLFFHIVTGDGVLDFLDLKIQGRVESFEAPLFAQEPEATISLLCYDPDFQDVKLGNSGERTGQLIGTSYLPYRGTIETGVTLTFPFNDPVGRVLIKVNKNDANYTSMGITFPFLPGDLLTLNTQRGSKSVILSRNGVNTSLLYALDTDSRWLELRPGTNEFYVESAGIVIIWRVIFVTRYGGL